MSGVSLRSCGFTVGVVARRIAADVGNPNFEPFQREVLVFGSDATDSLPVDVARHSAKRLEGFQPVQNLHVAYVPGVPDFVAWLEMGENGFVEVAMSI